MKFINTINRVTVKLSRINLFFLWGLLALLYFLLFSSILKLDDFTSLTGDDLDYQILAVNYCDGHGLMVDGLYDGIDHYKMHHPKNEKEISYYKGREKKHVFYRTPGYPVFFLGNLYRIVGVSPLIGKLAGLFLLCIVAAGLPFLCYLEWGRGSMLIGVVASFLQILSSYRWTEQIGTEPLIVFSLFLIVLCIQLFQVKRNVLYAILLGFLMAFGLLVKGSLIFLPFIVFAYYTWGNLKNKRNFLPLIVMFVAFASVISAWAVYASSKSTQTVVLSTQGAIVLLDGNNEYTQGGWEPRWADHPESFYMTDGLAGKSAVVRVANFYLHHPMLLPVLLFKKLIIGFVTQLFVCLIFIVWLFQSLLLRFRLKLRCLWFELLFVLILVFFSIFHIYTLNTSAFLWTVYFFLLTNKLVLILLVLLLLLYSYVIKPYFTSYLKEFPLIFSIVLLNFILLSVIIFGESRFVAVMNFLFIVYFLKLLQIFFNAKTKNEILFFKS